MSNEKLNVLIVEDEALVALGLQKGLEKDGYNVVGTADNAEEAEQLFTEHDVDIVLMDVKIMGCKDGIDTAADLMKIKQVPIIYLTAFTDNDTVSRIKNTYPVAFLAKPYNINNVRIAIELAINNLAIAKQQKDQAKQEAQKKSLPDTEDATTDKEVVLQMKDVLFVKYNYRFIKLPLSELLYVEADNNYVNLVTKKEKIALRLSLNQLLDKIFDDKLIRIHRSYAVNTEAIQSFNEQLLFIDKVEIPIGKNYRQNFFKHFNGN